MRRRTIKPAGNPQATSSTMRLYLAPFVPRDTASHIGAGSLVNLNQKLSIGKLLYIVLAASLNLLRNSRSLHYVSTFQNNAIEIVLPNLFNLFYSLNTSSFIAKFEAIYIRISQILPLSITKLLLTLRRPRRTGIPGSVTRRNPTGLPQPS